MGSDSKQPKKAGITTEHSAGGVVYRRNTRGYDIIAVQRARHGDWSLPKGHIEPDETPERAALREVKEETGLDARIIAPLGEVVYFYRRPQHGLTRKTVTYYLMEATGGELAGPSWEVSEVRWVPIAEAPNLLSYDNDRQLVSKAASLLDAHANGRPAN
jgi:8-oxo-dGTP pyrophosphatase MutT (NUDIX family)